jgi:hypothetical protein
MRVKDAPAVAAQPAMVVLLNDVEVPGHRSVWAPWCRPPVVPKVPGDFLTVTLAEHHEGHGRGRWCEPESGQGVRSTMTEGVRAAQSRPQAACPSMEGSSAVRPDAAHTAADRRAVGPVRDVLMIRSRRPSPVGLPAAGRSTLSPSKFVTITRQCQGARRAARPLAG